MEKITIFGYGSLLWDQEDNASNYRKASLYGWHREYSQLSSKSRGTREKPGLVLGLIKGGVCEGFIFEIPASDFQKWKRREGVKDNNTGNYLLKCSSDGDFEIKINEKLFSNNCYTVVSNKNSKAFVGGKSLKERAKIAIESSKNGGGERGNSIDYIKNNYYSYIKESINDPILKEMYEQVK